MIRIKVNNLEEPAVIDLLYKASRAGVKINLVIRSICCLVPGVENTSTNITVKRLVDRYLEHTRLMIFGTGENVQVIIGSADLMNRNLHHRVEVCVPVQNDSLKQELIDYFEIQWKDNDKAVILRLDGSMQKPEPDGQQVINAQNSIYNYLQSKS